jgi:hypothetical protein
MGLRKEREHLRWQEYMYHLNEAQAWLTQHLHFHIHNKNPKQK